MFQYTVFGNRKISEKNWLIKTMPQKTFSDLPTLFFKNEIFLAKRKSRYVVILARSKVWPPKHDQTEPQKVFSIFFYVS